GALRVQSNNALGAKTEEVQALVVTSSPFELSFNNGTITSTTAAGLTTGSASSVQTALNGLDSVRAAFGSVTATGSGTVADPYLVTFQGGFAGQNVNALTFASGAGVVTTRIDGNVGGTTVASGAELQFDGSVNLGNEALTVSGQGVQTRTSSAAAFTGALHVVSGAPTGGDGFTPVTLNGLRYLT